MKKIKLIPSCKIRVVEGGIFLRKLSWDNEGVW